MTENVIQSGFQSQSVSGSVLWQPHTHHRLRLSVSRESDRDARFATLPLHLEEDDAYLGSVTYTIRKPLPYVHSLEFTGYYNYVHHRMNNEHKPHRPGSGAGGGGRDGSGPGNMDRTGHPPSHDDHHMTATANGHGTTLDMQATPTRSDALYFRSTPGRLVGASRRICCPALADGWPLAATCIGSNARARTMCRS